MPCCNTTWAISWPSRPASSSSLQPEVEHAAGDHDLAAGQREGVGLRDVDQIEVDRRLSDARRLNDPIAEVRDPSQIGGTLQGSVLNQRLAGRVETLLEELGVGDLDCRNGLSEARSGVAKDEDQRCERHTCADYAFSTMR